jgi:hypothetical protein
MHRSTGNDDMHERLRRLLYEAFFGVDFDGTTSRSPHNERPRLMLVSPSRRGAFRREGKANDATALGDTGAPTAQAANGDEEPLARPAGVRGWSAPRLHRLP